MLLSFDNYSTNDSEIHMNEFGWVYSYNPSSWGVKAEGLQVQGQLGLWSKTLSQNQNQTIKIPSLGEVVTSVYIAYMRPWIRFPAPNKGGIEVPVTLAFGYGSRGSGRDQGYFHLHTKFEDKVRPYLKLTKRPSCMFSCWVCFSSLPSKYY